MAKPNIVKKMDDREMFFKNILDLFFETQVPKIIENIEGENISIGCLENAASVVNSYYWNFADNHIRPIISVEDGNSDSEFENYIDLYKILSTTEYAVMAVKPLFLLKDGIPIVEQDLSWDGRERMINAHFAFICALNLLSSWDGYTVEFSKDSGCERLFSYKETIKPREQDSLTIEEEHITILAYTKQNDTAPVFINSTWWRMVCLCQWVIIQAKKETNVDFLSKSSGNN